jgi:hypothetical protein
VATGLRREIDDGVDAVNRHQLSMAARMARLPAGLASALLAPPPLRLLTREAR